MAATIFLGIIFTGFQAFEYKTSTFSINDSVYGSIFYMATGFHGFHVLVGTLFIFFSLLRHIKYHFTVEQHFGFEAAA
jgi:heme/copper-type cytochrome/quinol oxidase subunit 3